MLHFRETLLPTDREVVRTLLAATQMFRPNEIEVAVEMVDERMQRGVASGYHFVFAEDDGRPLGYVCYGPISVTLHGYDLYWLVVDPTHQGQGFGRQLLQAAEHHIAALGGKQIYIETSGQATYQLTRRFYDRCGYELVATIAEFYAPGDDKLTYVRRLM